MNPLLFLIAFAVAAEPTLKPEDGPANYGLCLDTARAYPTQGLELAERWIGLGGGEPARHCKGVALFGLHKYADAARELEIIGVNSQRSNAIRASLLAQAGQAYMLGGDAAHARETQTAALKLVPPGSSATVPLLVDRALSFAEGKLYKDAIIDLTAALAIEPRNADALAYRANAERETAQLDAAEKDAQAAVEIDGANLTALLERGIVARLKDRDLEAKADWEKVIALAPESAEATAARGHLERIDVGAEPAKKGQPVKVPKKKR